MSAKGPSHTATAVGAAAPLRRARKALGNITNTAAVAAEAATAGAGGKPQPLIIKPPTAPIPTATTAAATTTTVTTKRPLSASDSLSGSGGGGLASNESTDFDSAKRLCTSRNRSLPALNQWGAEVVQRLMSDSGLIPDIACLVVDYGLEMGM